MTRTGRRWKFVGCRELDATDVSGTANVAAVEFTTCTVVVEIGIQISRLDWLSQRFKCNRSKLTEMPVLWAYARDLSQTLGFSSR